MIKRIKLFLNNKKGASKMIETLIILPIVLFITLLSFYKIMGMIVINQMNDFNRSLTRDVIVASNFDDAMVIAYEKMQNKTDYKISYIKIYYDDRSLSQSNLDEVTLNFSIIKDSNQGFNKYFLKNGNKTVLNSNLLQEQNRAVYTKLKENWKMSNLLEIGLYNDLTQNIYSQISKVSVWVNGERKEFSFALDSTLRTSNVQVISCEE